MEIESKYAYYRLILKFILFTILFGAYVFLLNSGGLYSNEMVYISNALVVIYSIYHLLANESRSFSAKKTFYLFVFFFMGVAPILQYKNGDQTVGGYDISESSYIFTNFLLFFVLICFDCFYYVFYEHAKCPLIKKLILEKNIILKNKERLKFRLTLIFTSLFSLFCTIYYNKDRLYTLLFRGVEGMVAEDTVQTGNYLSPFMSVFIRPLTVAVCVNYLCIGKSRWMKILLFFIMLISCFPTSLARLHAAAYYLPILIILFPALRWKNRYTYLFSLGLLVVFPLLNSFRNWGGKDGLNLRLDFEMFRTMHFDSYQSLAFVIQNDIVTYGKQLMLVFFFWVPRVVWENKPYMSGRMVAHEYGLWFDQISMNYWAEGYLNAGLVGVFLFTVVLAYITAMFDKSFWDNIHGNLNNLFAPFYLFFISIYFFFMRGDLMYGFQYTAMLLFTNYVVFRLIRKVY